MGTRTSTGPRTSSRKTNAGRRAPVSSARRMAMTTSASHSARAEEVAHVSVDVSVALFERLLFENAASVLRAHMSGVAVRSVRRCRA